VGTGLMIKDTNECQVKAAISFALCVSKLQKQEHRYLEASWRQK